MDAHPPKATIIIILAYFLPVFFFYVVFYTVEMIPKESFKQESNPFMELYPTSQ